MRVEMTRISRNDPLYPSLLKEISDPPQGLWVEGEPKVLDDFCIGVVGARDCTPYGKQVAHDLSREMAQVGITIVSGLAYGIDSAAHEGALAGGGKTIAVLGHGMNIPLSRERMELRRRIQRQGAVITEFDSDIPGSKWSFPRRNRIISGLSKGVVVVEAGLESGSLITAEFALQQGREVFAVPGNIKSPLSTGTHRLIQNGAKLVTCLKDILDEFNFCGMKATLIERAKPDSISFDGVTREEGAILSLLSDGPRHMDELVESLGYSVEKMSSLLMELEMSGRIEALSGSRFVLSKK